MKRKWILRALAVIALVLVVGFVAAAVSLGAIVKDGVERIGPRATKTDVTLKGAEIWLFNGRAELNDFVLGNPTGCKTPEAISVGSVSVQIKPSSLFTRKCIVNTIDFKAPVITLEGGLRKNNLLTIEKNINDYLKGKPSPATPPPAAPAQSAANSVPSGPANPVPSESSKKMQVNNLVISGARLQVNTMLTGGHTITLAIPDIHLTDLGTGPDGVTPVEIGQKALHAVLVAASETVAKNAGQLGKEALDGASGALDHVNTHNVAARLKGLFH